MHIHVWEWRVAEDSRSLAVSCNVRDETGAKRNSVSYYINRQAMLWLNAQAKLGNRPSFLCNCSSCALAERPSKSSSGGNRPSFLCNCSSYALAERPSKASSC